MMNKLEHEFRSEKNNFLFEEIKSIKTASVPIIKLQYKISNYKNYNKYFYDLKEIFILKFDISFFNIENRNKKHPSEQMVDFVRENVYLHPNIINLIYILKRFLQKRDLNDTYKGGLSSISLFLLILYFINNENEHLNLSLMLINFFKFYSDFRFNEKIIDVNDYFNYNNNNLLNRFEIFIQHPFCNINTAKSTFKIKNIQECFKEAFQILIKKLNFYNNNNFNELFPFLNDLIF